MKIDSPFTQVNNRVKSRQSIQNNYLFSVLFVLFNDMESNWCCPLHKIKFTMNSGHRGLISRNMVVIVAGFSDLCSETRSS